MPEALRPYWTPESRVYIDWARSVYVYPSQMATIASVGIPFKTVHSEAKVVDKNCTLLPNRTVTTESILGTASAAKAVEQGVADVVEGRTVEVSMPMTKHEALYDAARRYVESSRYEPDSKIQQELAEAVRQLTPLRADQAKIPDPLDQLAAEAQAEGEYGTAWDRWVNDHPPVYEWDLNAKSRPHVKDRFNAFIAAECERAVGRAKASPRFGHDPDLDDCDCRSCLREMFEQSKRTIEAMMKSSKNPTPRRTAREVAEGIVDEWFTRGRSSAELILAIVAAIERDREGR